MGKRVTITVRPAEDILKQLSIVERYNLLIGLCLATALFNLILVFSNFSWLGLIMFLLSALVASLSVWRIDAVRNDLKDKIDDAILHWMKQLESQE